MVCLERLTMCKRHEHSDVARFFFWCVCVCVISHAFVMYCALHVSTDQTLCVQSFVHFCAWYFKSVRLASCTNLRSRAA